VCIINNQFSGDEKACHFFFVSGVSGSAGLLGASFDLNILILFLIQYRLEGTGNNIPGFSDILFVPNFTLYFG
jgi:hypothetical protein